MRSGGHRNSGVETGALVRHPLVGLGWCQSAMGDRSRRSRMRLLLEVEMRQEGGDMSKR